MMERRRLAIGLKGMKNAKATKTKTKTFASLRRLKRRCFSRFSIPRGEEPVSRADLTPSWRETACLCPRSGVGCPRARPRVGRSRAGARAPRPGEESRGDIRERRRRRPRDVAPPLWRLCARVSPCACRTTRKRRSRRLLSEAKTKAAAAVTAPCPRSNASTRRTTRLGVGLASTSSSTSR